MRRSKYGKFLALLLCMIMALGMFPQMAYGAEEGLSKSITLQSEKSLKGKGYNWNAATHTLTLDDADLQATGKPIFILEEETDVKIVVRGNNTLTCEGAPVITGEGKGGRVTFSGIGTLQVNGYIRLQAKAVTIASCDLTVLPTAEQKGNRAFSNTGTEDFLVTGGARVKLQGGLYTGMFSGNLVVNGACLTVESDTFGSTVEVGGQVVLKNGGQLMVNNRYEAAMDYSRFSQAIYTIGGLDADETSTLKAESLSGAAVKIASGSCRMESQELELKGNQQAIIVQQFGGVTFILPTDEAWQYWPVQAKATNSSIYGGTLCAAPDERISYDALEESMQGGLAEVQFVSTDVRKAKESMENAVIEAASASYAKTETKNRRIKIWWQPADPEGEMLTGYEIARATKENGVYQTVYTTVKTSYTNSSGLKKGTKYYYKVRAYIQVNDTLYYSDWSNVTSKTAK